MLPTLKLVRGTVLFVAACLVLYGCDPGWSAVVRNETDHSVLIRLTHGHSEIGYLPAGSEGFLSGGLGVSRRGLEVLDLDCTTHQSVETGDQGSFTVVIAANGSTSVSPRQRSEPDVDTMRKLGRICGSYSACPWASPPWPDDVPKPSDPNLDYDAGC